ncbi:ankyrin repeat domain-containing protein [Spongiimicrobium salis]|uniref:ankyrin repeat domain-containing protein n=1 Tax=Spongiimicrobium salis TaxID=1667022 RepID=UPI00374D226E
MKTSKTNTLQKWISFSFVLILLTAACGQSNKKESSQAEANAPTIDIHAAVLSGNLEIVKQHIEAGTDINQKEVMSGSTPLISAASFGKKDIAKALINAGADLTPKNNDGSTALHAAAFFCRVEIVQLLIDAQIDKNMRNNFGATARESVMVPFAEVKPIYEMLQQQLGPIGLKLDLNEVEKTRPVIAMMLQ